MPTEITPNGRIGRQVDRRERRKKLKTERDAIVAALDVWLSNTNYPTQITNNATLTALYREERKLLRDVAQALRVLISVQLEELDEEEVN